MARAKKTPAPEFWWLMIDDSPSPTRFTFFGTQEHALKEFSAWCDDGYGELLKCELFATGGPPESKPIITLCGENK